MAEQEERPVEVPAVAEEVQVKEEEQAAPAQPDAAAPGAAGVIPVGNGYVANRISTEEMKRMIDSGEKKLVRILPDRANTWHPGVVNPKSFPGLVSGLTLDPTEAKFMTSCAFLESASMSPQHRLLLRYVPNLKEMVESALTRLGEVEEGKMNARLYSLIHSSLLLAWKLKDDLEAAQRCSVALEDPPLVDLKDETIPDKFTGYLDDVWKTVRVMGIDKKNGGGPPKNFGTPEEKGKVLLAEDVKRRLKECIQCKKPLEGKEKALMRLSIHPRIPSLFLPVLSCLVCKPLGNETSVKRQGEKVEKGDTEPLWDTFIKLMPEYHICRVQAECQAMRMLRKAHIPPDFLPRWTKQGWKMCEDDLCPRCNLDVSPNKKLVELELTSLRCSVCHKKMKTRGVPTRHFDRANFPPDIVHCGTRYVCSDDCQVKHSKLIAEASNGNLKPEDILKKASDVHAKCGSCNVQKAKKDLKVCNGCQDTYYCGRECQVKSWKSGHKLECKQKQAQRAIDRAQLKK